MAVEADWRLSMVPRCESKWTDVMDLSRVYSLPSLYANQRYASADPSTPRLDKVGEIMDGCMEGRTDGVFIGLSRALCIYTVPTFLPLPFFTRID